MKLNIFRKIGIFLLLLISCSEINFAQENEDQKALKPKTELKESYCEENNSFLGILAQNAKPDEIIIIISHLNKDEKINSGRRRLHNAATFLTKGFATEIKHSSIVFAEGEKTNNQGHLDFFIKGTLELRIFFRKNQDLRLPPCVFQFPEEKPCETKFEKLFYPCKKD